MEAVVTPIDDLWWTATKYSDVLKIDRRVCQQALETAPYKMIGKRQVWHVREGMPAIFARVGSKNRLDPNSMDPKDQLDYYRAQREKIRLAEDIGKVIPATVVERTVGEAFKVLAQTLDVLPDMLERDCALPLPSVTLVQQAIDGARETLYRTLMASLSGGDGVGDG